MAGVPALLSWRDVELGAPELARLGMARLNSAHVALLGTLRRDGSPGISSIEPCIAEGQLLIGAMAWSAKASDLRRDPRYALHSVVTGPDTGEGELKLYGPAVEAARTCAQRQPARGGRSQRRKRPSCSPCTLGRPCSSAGT